MWNKSGGSLAVGLVIPCSIPFHEIFDEVLESGYTFVAANLAHPRCCLDAESRQGQLPPFSIADKIMSSRSWELGVVGVVSPWIDVDSDDAALVALSERELRAELNYFDYLCVGAILIELKKPCVNLARFLNGCLQHTVRSRNVKILVRVALAAANGDADPWEWWSLLRSICDQSLNISVVLEIGADLPENPKVVERWFGEMLYAVYMKRTVFLAGSKRCQPKLSSAHWELLGRVFDHVNHAFIEFEKFGRELRGCSAYALATRLVWEHFYGAKKSDRTYEHYRDVVQLPLEPLADDLRSDTYEVFEGDSMKYRMYGYAFEKAILDRRAASSSVVIMIVGAGRGSLVSVVLEVLAALHVTNAEVYAIEKNPSAVVSLNHANSTRWNNEVIVVEGDMRSVSLPVKADIMISEMLGSFGDNELSPECLDGASHLLKDDAISIPSSYESFVSPAHSAKVSSQMTHLFTGKGRTEFVPFETMIVVKLHSHFVISPPKSVFRFLHPNRGQLSNNRYKRILFEAPIDCTLGGFACYFRANLYGDVFLSTVPEEHTPNMESWFPMWIPLQHSIQLKKGQTIELHIWRFSTDEKVWYEWTVTQPVVTHIHNSNGRTSFVRVAIGEKI